MLDVELGRGLDDLPLAEAVHDSTKGAEIDALRGVGQSGFGHGGFPLTDDSLIDIGRRDLGFLATGFKGLLFGAFHLDAGDGAAEEAIEVLQRGAVLQTGLLGVLALAKLHPVLE